MSQEFQTETRTRPILEVQNLEVSFSRRLPWFKSDTLKAVEDVTFSVFPGETLALVGESGSGKTTSAKAVLRLLNPSAGRILFMSREWAGLSRRRLLPMRRQMQAIFQDPYSSLNPRRKVGRIVAEPLVVHRMDLHGSALSDRSAELLDRVGLRSSYAERYPHELSGGQRQRVAIARALALSPAMIVCDEAVSALDVSVKAQIINLLKDLQDDEGIALLFISHDMSAVRSIAHRVAVMKQGRIVEMGEADGVFRNPQSEYTKLLLRSVPLANPTRERARG